MSKRTYVEVFEWRCPLCGGSGPINPDDNGMIADAAMRLHHCREHPQCLNSFFGPKTNDLKVYARGTEIITEE